jgi:hypothetical protein
VRGADDLAPKKPIGPWRAASPAALARLTICSRFVAGRARRRFGAEAGFVARRKCAQMALE